MTRNIVAVYPTTGGHSVGSGRAVRFLPAAQPGQTDVVVRVSWGSHDTMELLFSRVCQAFPQTNQVDFLNIVHNDLAAHFVALLATNEGRGNLRGIVMRCFRPGSTIILVVSADMMRSLLRYGDSYTQTFQAATQANARILIGGPSGPPIAVN